MIAGAAMVLMLAAGEPTAPLPPAVSAAGMFLKVPSQMEMLRVYPKRAMRRRAGGTAAISCLVDGEGLLQQCQVVTETPTGLGFGDAALKLAPRFRLIKTAPDGRSTEGGRLTIPLNFHAPP